jgi:hypothetical protein
MSRDRGYVHRRREDLQQLFFTQRKAGETTARALTRTILEATQVQITGDVLDAFVSTLTATRDLEESLKMAFNKAGIGVTK